MADLRADYERVREALATPTLTLLDRKSAVVVLPLLSTLFDEETIGISIDRFHSAVDGHLAELRSAGYPDIPTTEGKLLARQWVSEHWLYRDPGRDQDREETYQLTGATRSAMDYVLRATRTQLNVSVSRIQTMRRVISDAALAVNPDRDERMRRLAEEISRLQQEYGELAEGGPLAGPSDSELAEQFSNVLRELDGLPSDFRRVEETVREMQQDLMRRFREETSPLGEVIDDYLDRASDLLTQTPEGRAFTGALELLRNRGWLESMTTDLTAILEHPFAGTLTDDEVRQVRGAVQVIRRGKDSVLDQRRRASATLSEQISTYDHIGNKALEEVLTGVETEIRRWMLTAKPRHHVDVEIIPPGLELTMLRARLFDPDSEKVPAPVAEEPAEIPTPPSLEELRARGGPTLDRLRDQIETRLDECASPSVGELFEDLPEDLKRPVEVIGLLRLFMDRDAQLGDERAEVVETIRPDGSRRRFSLTTARLHTDPPSPLSNLAPKEES